MPGDKDAVVAILNVSEVARKSLGNVLIGAI